MKKIFFGAFILFCAGFISVAQDIPVYEGKGADVAILVDIKVNKGVKDNIVLVNLANPDGMIFDVYVYEKAYEESFEKVFQEKTILL